MKETSFYTFLVSRGHRFLHIHEIKVTNDYADHSTIIRRVTHVHMITSYKLIISMSSVSISIHNMMIFYLIIYYI